MENKQYGKPKGTYVTIDIKKLKIATDEEIEETANTLAEELKEIVQKHIDKEAEVLVVGLGNEYVTPDSLGPKVVSGIEVTRHVIKYLPEYVEEGTRRNKRNIARSTWNNRNRNTRNIRGNSRQHQSKASNSNRCTSIKKHRKNK